MQRPRRWLERIIQLKSNGTDERPASRAGGGNRISICLKQNTYGGVEVVRGVAGVGLRDLDERGAVALRARRSDDRSEY